MSFGRSEPDDRADDPLPNNRRPPSHTSTASNSAAERLDAVASVAASRSPAPAEEVHRHELAHA